MEPYMYYRMNELDFIGAIHLSPAIFKNGPVAYGQGMQVMRCMTEFLEIP